LQRGDCLLLDYRTLHAGMPNQSTRARPVLYLVYARRWFFDDVNYMNRVPLDMPAERFAELPETLRPLMVRAYSFALHAGKAEAAPHAVKPARFDPASLAKVGRNDLCPCGSEKKYKHCHGRVA
jgi:hypothetical protein